MKKQLIRTKDENSINTYLIFTICLFVLLGTNILFNAWICAGNRVFHADDLLVVNKFLRSSAGEFIFSTGANKIRIVAQTMVWIILKVSEGNWELIDEILLILNFINATVVFVFAYIVQRNAENIRRCGLALICGVLFIASRFAYYNISELLGVMEGIAVTFALGILLLLFLYMEKGGQKYFYSAIGLYFLLIFTHERYFVLFIIFFVPLFFKKNMNLKEKTKKALLPLMVVGIFWIIRIVLFGNRAIDGTGGTSVSDTFDVLTAIEYCFSQVMYILGVNCGPEYLNGIEAKQVPLFIHTLVFLNIVFVLCMLVIYLRLMIKDRQFRYENLKIFVLFISFIALCIICSSVTIRVEMRWIYVSYAAYLVLLIYMMHGILLYYPIDVRKIALTGFWVVLLLITEQFYRMHYSNIFYWQEKDLSKELYDVTVGKYGSEIENKNIIIIGDVWKERTLDEWKLFFTPYLKSDGINVIYVENTYEAEQCVKNIGNKIVLFEDSKTRRYTDITAKMSGVARKYGIYEDGWCDMDCEFEVMGNITDRVTLTLYYPEDCEVKGTPNGTIIVNGENRIDFELTSNLTTIELELDPYPINAVQVKLNYWVYENTGRSEDGRISSVLTVEADF